MRDRFTAASQPARHRLSIALALAALSVWLALPSLPVGRAGGSTVADQSLTQRSSGSSLSADRQTALEKLYAQFKAGDPFSEEESNLLREFGAGRSLTVLEADLVIARALYEYYIAGRELTKEQQGLLVEYSLFVARRKSDIADLKTRLLNKRIAAAAAAAPRNTPLVAPSNDLCSGAEIIPGAGPFPYLTAVTADITDATTTNDPPLPSCQTNVSRSIWYKFTPAATATYTISTCSFDGTATAVDDTVMAIYTSSTNTCVGTLTEVPTGGVTDGCDDDACVDEAAQSVITTVLNGATPYFVVIWEFGPAAPAAGNTAVQLRVSQTTVPGNDACAGAQALTLNTPVNGTTVGANLDYQLSGAACFTGIGQTSSTAAGRDVVYSFTAPSADNYSFKVTDYNTMRNLVLYVASTCPSGSPPITVSTCLAAANRTNGSTAEEVSCIALSAAQQVFIFVDEDSASTGSAFTIEVNRCAKETEANDTPATANAFVFGMEGSIGSVSDVDFFSLGTPASGSRVFALVDGVAANGVPANDGGDFDLRVTSTTDTLEYDDSNAASEFGRFSPTVAGTALTGTPSFLRVNNLAGQAAEPYRLYAVVQPPSTSATLETEPNDTPAQANSAANNYFSGSLTGPAPSSDVDGFSFTANAGDLIFLSLDCDPLRNNTPINGALALIASNGVTTLISVNDNGSTSSTTSGAGSLTATTPFSPAESLVWRAATTGTYYAVVFISPNSSGATGSGDYLLSISRNGQVGPTLARFNNDPSNAAAATRYGDGVSITWRTGFEVDNLGFNLYREENRQRVRVNSQIIAGSALMVGAGMPVSSGKAYTWFDNARPNRNAQYWIEALDLNGESSWYGPVAISPSVGKLEAAGRATTLAQLGRASPLESQSTSLERRAEVSTVSSSGVAIQAVIGGQSAAKLSVKREGLYRVTQPELVAAGFNPKVDPRNLRLFVDGRELPIIVDAKDKFDSSCAIEFYGIGVDSAATDDHVYWLVAGSQAGARIEQISASTGQRLSQSFLSSVELKPRTIYFAALRNGERENFFGPVIAREPVDQALALQHVDTLSTNGAILEVALQGVTLAGHRVEVQINGEPAGELLFNGQEAGTARLPVAQKLLREGANIVRLVALGGPSDISLVNYLRLTYWHTFTADNDQLRFNAPGKQNVSIGGFSNNDIRVFDVTDPNSPQEILAPIKPGKTGYAVTLGVPGKGLRTLLAMTNNTAKRPAGISLDQPSNWRQPGNGANLVVFTRREFMMALEPLKVLRESQGYKVAVVDIEDVYDEFSHGNKTPQAIKDFLAYARSNWMIAPQFVLLAGDASYDAKNYLGFGTNDLVPSGMIDTQLMETASDDWLADFDDDGLAEMAVGRLPIRSAREGAIVVAKIANYDRAARSDGVLLVADDSLDGVDFEAASGQLLGLIPAGQRVEMISRGNLDPATAKSRLMEAINRGPKVVNYQGHGNLDGWRAGLFTTQDAGSLGNGGNLSVFVMMTCLNGYFHDAQKDSLGESLLRAEKGGAVAVWASSGMTLPSDQGVMDLEMFRRLFDANNSLTLGEATLRAKAAALNKDVRLTWVLLGDPATRLR